MWRAGGTGGSAAASALALMLLVGCSGPGPAEITGLIDIGDDRRLHLTCRGAGEPVVLLISGTRGAADEWDTLEDDAAPGTPTVFAAVSEVTRVCAYDRPGTIADSGIPTRSTLVPQPTTARQGSDDLRALTDAVGEHGPYVLAGLSWGGMIAQQFAASHPDAVVGLVLLESASPYIEETLTSEQWSAWMAAVAASADGTGAEVPAYPQSIADLGASGPLPSVPATVVSADQPWDLRVTPGLSTWPAWVRAQAALASSLDATRITRTRSGHGLPVEQPQLVSAAIIDVVEAAREAARVSR